MYTLLRLYSRHKIASSAYKRLSFQNFILHWVKSCNFNVCSLADYREEFAMSAQSTARIHNSRAPGRHGDWICTVVTNISGFSIWNFFHVTLLAPRILMRLPEFWKICTHLGYGHCAIPRQQRFTTNHFHIRPSFCNFNANCAWFSSLRQAVLHPDMKSTRIFPQQQIDSPRSAWRQYSITSSFSFLAS